jgi:hypothetical protein
MISQLAHISRRHTATPQQCWYCVWVGFGFPSKMFWFRGTNPSVEEQARQAAEHRRLVAEQEARHAEVRAELASIPTLSLPQRDYYVLHGAVTEASRLLEPVFRDSAQYPSLWWPEDRAWTIASEIDLPYTLVGGTTAFTNEVRSGVDYPTEPVTPADRLAIGRT